MVEKEKEQQQQPQQSYQPQTQPEMEVPGMIRRPPSQTLDSSGDHAHESSSEDAEEHPDAHFHMEEESGEGEEGEGLRNGEPVESPTREQRRLLFGSSTEGSSISRSENEEYTPNEEFQQQRQTIIDRFVCLIDFIIFAFKFILKKKNRYDEFAVRENVGGQVVVAPDTSSRQFSTSSTTQDNYYNYQAQDFSTVPTSGAFGASDEIGKVDYTAEEMQMASELTRLQELPSGDFANEPDEREEEEHFRQQQQQQQQQANDQVIPVFETSSSFVNNENYYYQTDQMLPQAEPMEPMVEAEEEEEEIVETPEPDQSDFFMQQQRQQQQTQQQQQQGLVYNKDDEGYGQSAMEQGQQGVDEIGFASSFQQQPIYIPRDEDYYYQNSSSHHSRQSFEQLNVDEGQVEEEEEEGDEFAFGTREPNADDEPEMCPVCMTTQLTQEQSAAMCADCERFVCSKCGGYSQAAEEAAAEHKVPQWLCRECESRRQFELRQTLTEQWASSGSKDRRLQKAATISTELAHDMPQPQSSSQSSLSSSQKNQTGDKQMMMPSAQFLRRQSLPDVLDDSGEPENASKTTTATSVKMRDSGSGKRPKHFDSGEEGSLSIGPSASEIVAGSFPTQFDSSQFVPQDEQPLDMQSHSVPVNVQGEEEEEEEMEPLDFAHPSSYQQYQPQQAEPVVEPSEEYQQEELVEEEGERFEGIEGEYPAYLEEAGLEGHEEEQEQMMGAAEQEGGEVEEMQFEDEMDFQQETYDQDDVPMDMTGDIGGDNGEYMVPYSSTSTNPFRIQAQPQEQPAVELTSQQAFLKHLQQADYEAEQVVPPEFNFGPIEPEEPELQYLTSEQNGNETAAGGLLPEEFEYQDARWYSQYSDENLQQSAEQPAAGTADQAQLSAGDLSSGDGMMGVESDQQQQQQQSSSTLSVIPPLSSATSTGPTTTTTTKTTQQQFSSTFSNQPESNYDQPVNFFFLHLTL